MKQRPRFSPIKLAARTGYTRSKIRSAMKVLGLKQMDSAKQVHAVVAFLSKWPNDLPISMDKYVAWRAGQSKEMKDILQCPEPTVRELNDEDVDLNELLRRWNPEKLSTMVSQRKPITYFPDETSAGYKQRFAEWEKVSCKTCGKLGAWVYTSCWMCREKERIQAVKAAKKSKPRVKKNLICDNCFRDFQCVSSNKYCPSCTHRFVSERPVVNSWWDRPPCLVCGMKISRYHAKGMCVYCYKKDWRSTAA